MCAEAPLRRTSCWADAFHEDMDLLLSNHRVLTSVEGNTLTLWCPMDVKMISLVFALATIQRSIFLAESLGCNRCEETTACCIQCSAVPPPVSQSGTPCLSADPIAPGQIDAYGTVAHLAKAAMTGVKLARLPNTIEDVRSRCRSLKHAIDMIHEEIEFHDRCRACVGASGQILTIAQLVPATLLKDDDGRVTLMCTLITVCADVTAPCSSQCLAGGRCSRA